MKTFIIRPIFNRGFHRFLSGLMLTLGGAFLLSCTNSDKDEVVKDYKIYPSSITVISNTDLKMGIGCTSTIDFRVSPSDAFFNYDVTSPNCQIELDYLGSNTNTGNNTRSGYVTNTSHIKLTKVEQMYDCDQRKLEGQYRAYITDQREIRNYNDRLCLVLTVPENNGSEVQISSSVINISLNVGHITSFGFKASDNARLLQEDLMCEINNNVICGRIPHIVEGMNLTPEIKFEGEGKLVLQSAPDKDIKTVTDFSCPVVYDVIDEETDEILDTYEVYISSYTGLPVLWVETEGRKNITSKDEYINASCKLEENLGTNASGKVLEAPGKIKGRGNSSWSYTDKKSYTLKFDKKVSIFDEPKDKSYVLIANSFDKTMLRNYIAYYMGKLSNLDYSPTFHFIELFLNGEYRGTYMLGDKLKISKDRVNVGDDGYLLEIDSRAPYENGIFFYTPKFPSPVSIKDPDIEPGSDAFIYIEDFVNKAEEVLFSKHFTDPTEGWQKYMDIESFVDWYIINEIARNNDPLHFNTSAYMNLRRGGKLIMGPLWDFDVTFGNNTNPDVYPVEGLSVYGSTWFNRLMQDPVFVTKVKDRFEYFYNKRAMILNELNTMSSYLRYSVEENDNKWKFLYTSGFANYNTWGRYKNEVEYLKKWICDRMDWLKLEFDKM